MAIDHAACPMEVREALEALQVMLVIPQSNKPKSSPGCGRGAIIADAIIAEEVFVAACGYQKLAAMLDRGVYSVL
jgi:hypothetical protein